MPITTGDIQALLVPGLKTAFFDTFAEQASQWKDVATEIQSDKDTEQYAWLGALPGVHEFLDERKTGDFSEYQYAIKNKTWESTISVDRAALEDDLYGQIAIKARSMAQTAAQHLDITVYGMLEGGFVNKCFDGQPFFGSHTQGRDAGGAPITQSNSMSGLLSALSLQAAITQMMRYRDDQGRPMGIIPDRLVVPPELYWEAAVILNSAFYPDPVSTASQQLAMNPLKGLLSLTTSPYLTNPNDWYLLDTKRVVKGVVLQMRKPFEFEALEQNSETGFMRDVYHYGVRARYNAGYGDWRAAFGANN